MGKAAHCHKLVAETAIEMTHALYDECMKNNVWYESWKNSHPGAHPKKLEELFVRKNWGKHVEGARAILAGMLAGPTPDPLKEQIYEALVLDNTLVRGRKDKNLLVL